MSPLGSSTSSAPQGKASRRAGFSMMELITTICVLGFITSISISLIADDPGAAKVAKLQSDIATLNQMVALYISDGGSVTGLSTPQQVIDKMKRSRPNAEWKSHVGVVSGRTLDVRLKARMTNTPDADNNPRVVWNSKKARFELSKAAGAAASEFYLDDALAGTDPGSESRSKMTVAYNSNKQGWVWKDVATATPNYLAADEHGPNGTPGPFDPTEAAPATSTPPTGGDSGGSSGGSSGGGGTDDGSTPPTISRLPRPLILPLGGTYAYLAFPTTATLDASGAPSSASKLMYSINGGSWTAYTGVPITVTPAMSLKAYNETTRPAEYLSSAVNSQTYYRLTSGFTGTGDGTWGNAIGGPNLVTNIQNDGANGSATFKHGNTKLDLGNGQYLDAGVENVLTFTPLSFDTIVPNKWFDFGNLLMLNGTTFYDSEATGATLSVKLNLTQPAIDVTTHIDLGFTSTENTSDRLASADIIELKSPTTDVTINIDGVQYRLELSWQTLDPGAGVVDGNKFLVFEGATAQARLLARFTSDR